MAFYKAQQCDQTNWLFDINLIDIILLIKWLFEPTTLTSCFFFALAVRAMCGQKIVDRKTTEEQMDMLGLKETIDRLATANGVRWYGHVLRRDDDSVLRVALNLEVTGKRKRGRPKKTWKKQVEEETEKVGLKKEDALRRDKWRNGVREIAEGMG